MSNLYIGLMSGTSADAIDAVLFEQNDAARGSVRGHIQHPLDESTRDSIMALSSRQSDSLQRLLELDWEMAAHFASAARKLLKQTGIEAKQVSAIGSHGQTIRHQPPSATAPDTPCFSLQIGDPNRIAELTGINVVADFRRRDLAAGGQAAPLVPAFHAAWFGQADKRLVVINLGGIANLSLIEGTHCRGGFDSGPANGLMDCWIEQQTGEQMDRDGSWARQGSLQPKLLRQMLQEPWFSTPAPKSTGRELFNLQWIQSFDVGRFEPVDVQRTLAELTAASLIDAIDSTGFQPDELVLCGGGCRNALLTDRIRELAGAVPVTSCQQFGLEPEQVEAAAFAWLAHCRVNNIAGNQIEVTGARGPRVLGGLYKA